MFRLGLTIATVGLVWTLWPGPGQRAYLSVNWRTRSRYHLGPRVAIDLGHFNDSPADARFRGLGDLLNWDGYRVTRSRQYLVPEYLKDFSVLVIGNAMPYPPGFGRVAKAAGLAGRTVFAPEETDAVRDWVRAGGSLLLEADVPGSGQAAAPLGTALGLVFHECPAPVFLSETKPGEHGILSGRSEYDEQVSSAAVLAGGWIEVTGTAVRAVPLLSAPEAAAGVCPAGKPIAVALEPGVGRVVALSVQLERNEDLIRLTGVDPRRAGNRQFVLNAMHWLSRGN